MQQEEADRSNSNPELQRHDGKSSIRLSKGMTVESLSAVLEKKALGKLQGSSKGPYTGQKSSGKSREQMSAMEAMLAEKLEILEKRTDDEIKRIVRREYMEEAMGQK